MAVKKKVNEVLRETAKEIVNGSLSPIMENREKLDTADIVGEELHVIDYDFADMADGSHFVIVVFAEYPDNYYSAGHIMTKLFNKMEESFGEEILHKELQKDGGLGIKLSASKTKDGKKSLTLVEVL